MEIEKKTPEPKVAEYEKVISQIKGVISTRLVTDDRGAIEEIHVLAVPERNPKQVVRDIETAVMVQLGTVIDRKKISVAQLALEEKARESPSLYLTGIRDFKLLRINLISSGLDAEVTVEIGIDEETFVGQISGLNAPSFFPRLVASATLAAVEKYLTGSYRLALEDVRKIRLGGQEAVVVLVLCLSAQGEERILGAAFAGADDVAAVGKAVLQAVGCLLCGQKRQGM
ncbi:MAG: hypothetical protein PWP65_1333 [Clostridia bacterium]|nr:hypothetical protein [Clostridia bacterium]